MVFAPEQESRQIGMDGATRTRKPASRKVAPAASAPARRASGKGETAKAAARKGGARHRARAEPIALAPPRCSPADQLRVLAASPFFARLSRTELARVARHFRQASFAAGHVIHSAGEPAARLSFVAIGHVKIAHPTPDGHDVLIALLGAGEYFGTVAELGDPVYRDAAAAHTDCCVLSIDADAFRGLLHRYPSVALAGLELTAARLRAARHTIEQLGIYPADRRLAATLLALAERMGRPEAGGTMIDMQLSRQDLAQMTGATVETVSRILGEFDRARLIDSGRQWIAVRDHDRLSRLAHGTHA
ncbi:MAG TPA: Crp/Fnr family transcriptional regulator [Burkholderiaceae bacterium]|jgi:CRP-like cAMP-binding protein|nr:Crp/Fnr family transcriptional regulator [Burkholderiaceae bacterium]HRA79701.1 Crp/Fnr family transcriptional regulator [Burkholderiaceae bacterium]